MSEPSPNTDPWSSEDHSAARNEFYMAMGKAASWWAYVEDGLFEWFKQCTGMHERLARAVFYSARSFEGRRDMLEAAIPFSPCDENTRIGIRKCLLRAGQYAAFRNRLAHRHLSFVHMAERPAQFALIEGRLGAGPINPENCITIDQIKTATHNFETLTHCIVGFHPEWQAPDVCEQGCLEEILALPSAADSSEPSQP